MKGVRVTVLFEPEQDLCDEHRWPEPIVVPTDATTVIQRTCRECGAVKVVSEHLDPFVFLRLMSER